MSSGDKVRTEGSNVTLECSAHGSPKPTVTWKREDRLDITIDRSKNITGIDNQEIKISMKNTIILFLYDISSHELLSYRIRCLFWLKSFFPMSTRL